MTERSACVIKLELKKKKLIVEVIRRWKKIYGRIDIDEQFLTEEKNLVSSEKRKIKRKYISFKNISIINGKRFD